MNRIREYINNNPAQWESDIENTVGNGRDRSEEEVAGYRKALDFIHKKHAGLKINEGTIKELHRLCRGESWDVGKWKEKDNDIIRKHADGRMVMAGRRGC